MKPIGENKADVDERLYRTILIQCGKPEDVVAWISVNYKRLRRIYFRDTHVMKRYGTREDLFHQTILKIIADAIH